MLNQENTLEKKLSDNTEIAGTKWKNLKQIVMSGKGNWLVSLPKGSTVSNKGKNLQLNRERDSLTTYRQVAENRDAR